MLHIATANTGPQDNEIIYHLFESVRKHCSQKFMLHVCNNVNNKPIKEFRTRNRKQIKIYTHIIKSAHSCNKHAAALNYLLNVLPRDNPIVICDSDIYFTEHFDVRLDEIYNDYIANNK